MIKCPFCQATHVVNTVFCSECGHYLLEDVKPETDPLETIEMSMRDEAPEEQSDSLSQPGTEPKVIQLKIGNSNREVELPLHKPIQLGRVDPASDTFPDIDLSVYGDTIKGVSRRHARIFREGNRVFAEDLASVNGTFVNGTRLDPYLPVTLSDGDLLQLGKVWIEVTIVSQ